MKPFDPAVLPHLLPARRPLVVGLVAGLAGGLLVVGQAWAIGTLIVALVTDPGGSGWHAAAWWLGAVVLARAAASYAVDVSGARAAALVSTALRRRLLEAAARLDPLDLSRHRTGELTALTTRGLASVEPYLTRYLPALVLAAALPAATVAALFWLDWLSGLVVVLTLPLVPVFAILIGLGTRDRADRQWRQLATLSGHFLDVVRGLPTLVAHNRAEAQSRSIRQVTDRYRRATMDTLRLAFASSAALELIATISVALVAVVVGLRLASGSLDFETALIVLLLAPEAYWPWRRVGAEFHAAAEGTATFAAADRLLRAAPPQVAPGSAPGRPVGVALEDVQLTFPGRSVPALSPVSASLPATGLVAVVGPSGAGKSTLLHLLTGELRPTAGRVLVNGVPLDELSGEAWRASIATAPQEVWLTAGSIAENLRVARPTASDAALWQALAAVDMDEVVATLPAGLATALGEDGAGLSAGQRARLGLARVVLADRPVVLLDEPSAHLDDATETVLLRTLQDLSRRCLVVVVAHRPAVLDLADQVVEVPGGIATDPVPHASGASVPARPPRGDALPSTVVPPTSPPAGAAADRPADLRPGRFGLRTGTVLGALSVLSGVALTATAAWLITRAAEHPPVLMLMVAIVGVRTFGLARPALRYAERLVSHDAALRLLAEHRAQVYDALVPLVPGRLGTRRGDLLTSVVDDVDAVVDEQLRVRQPRWTATLALVAAALLAGWAHPVAAVVVLSVGAAGAVSHRITARGVAAAEPRFVAARAELSTRVEAFLHSVRQLVLWQATDRALDAVDATAGRLARAALRSARATALGRAIVISACGLGLVAMAGLLEAPLARGDLSPAMTALLVMLALALADAVSPLPDAAALQVRTRAARDRLAALTGQEPAVVVSQSVERPVLEHPHGSLRDVTAGWGSTPAVTGLDLDLPPGARIGLVGPSGCGKSTVAALLLRFLDPTTGSVTWDGTDARDLPPALVRSRVGLVDDAPYVFASSVVENVRLARPEAGDEDVARALDLAHLGSWVASLPDGLQTMIGEGHAHVSGGERARLAVARALLADQPVLVLDEPTAHLDAATARAVASEVLRQHGRTIVWITHQSVGLDAVDEVVELGTEPAVSPPARPRRAEVAR